MNQRIIDAAVEVFQLGPEHQDELLRFAMKLQDMEDQERQQEPVAWMNQSGEVASQEDLDHWSRTGRPAFAAFTIPLYRHPPATRLSEEVRGLSVEQVMEILQSADIMVPIERFFKDGEHITKKEYGQVVHELLCKEVRSKLESLNTDSHGK
jgi:hypothetical protein